MIKSDSSEITLAIGGIAACFSSSEEGKAFKTAKAEKIKFILTEAEKQPEYWLGELNLEVLTKQLTCDVFLSQSLKRRTKTQGTYMIKIAKI